MHVVQLVIKNASELDFTLPVLRDLRDRKLAEVTVVYCVADRSQILRDSMVYADALERVGAKQLDFGDLLPGGNKIVATAWRRLFAKSASDEYSIRQSLAAVRRAKLSTRHGRTAARQLTRAAVDRGLRSAQKFALRATRIATMLPSLDPDVVLLGNRTVTDFPMRQQVFDYFASGPSRVILVPHAAHETEPREFMPYDERGDPLPAHVEYWLALRDAETWADYPGREAQFVHVGYPGLDRAWAAWLRDQVCSPERRHGRHPLKLVVVGRKFLPRGAQPVDDPFTLTFDEMWDHLVAIREAVGSCGAPYRVVLKPHPSTNRFLLGDLLTELGVSWPVSFDPLGALSADAAAVTGLFSTSLIMPVPFGCAVIPISSRIQELVEGRWVVMKKLYRGFDKYVTDPNTELAGRLREAAAGRTEVGSLGALRRTSEQANVEQFFPDDPVGRCRERILRTGS